MRPIARNPWLRLTALVLVASAAECLAAFVYTVAFLSNTEFGAFAVAGSFLVFFLPALALAAMAYGLLRGHGWLIALLWLAAVLLAVSMAPLLDQRYSSTADLLLPHWEGWLFLAGFGLSLACSVAALVWRRRRGGDGAAIP